MAMSPSSSHGGGTFNGGTITTALVVDQGFGAEGDYQEGDVFLFDKSNRSSAELASNAASANLEIQQNPASTSNPPIRYRLIGSGGFFFYIDTNGTIVTRSVTAPADVDLANSSLALYLDDTPAATKLMVKAKDSGGTVRSGSIALA